MRSPDESKKTQKMDLFPFTKARLADVPFRPTDLGPQRSPDDLRRNLLKVVFGWDNDIDDLIRDELARHIPGSGAAVLLSKWLLLSPFSRACWYWKAGSAISELM